MLDNLDIIEGLMDYLLDWWIGCKLFDTLMTVKMVLKLPMIQPFSFPSCCMLLAGSVGH